MQAVGEGLKDRPMYGPVRLDSLDAPARRLMNRLAIAGTGFGAEIVRFDKREPLTRLSEAIGHRVQTGMAKEGLEVEDLCKGKTATGRVREGMVEPMRDVVDIGARAILALSNRPPIHEWFASISVKAGDENNAIGVDRNPGAGTRAHVLLGAIGASDRQVLGQAEWLKKGTRDDHSCERADPERIARYAAELKKPIPGPFHEHLDRNFKAEDRARKLVEVAAAKRSPAFTHFGINPDRFLEKYFPRCLILGSIPYGPPVRRGAASADVFLPGDDDATVSVVEGADRYGVACCTLGEAEIDLDKLEDCLLPELTERFGEVPQEIPQEQLNAVIKRPVVIELRVGESIPLVRYWYFPKAHRLLRVMQISGPDGAEVLDVHLWRCIRLDGRLFWAAIALIERAHQPWSFSCLARFGREFAPGLAHTWKALPREGLLRASLLPNAAGVCAHRRMEQLRDLGR